jgi:hypothetical protein
MTTQLRLVDLPRRCAGPQIHVPGQIRPPHPGPRHPGRTTRARVVTSARTGTTSSRRAARWGDWHLDDRTRRIGAEGVAAAREALERAAALDALRHAS